MDPFLLAPCYGPVIPKVWVYFHLAYSSVLETLCSSISPSGNSCDASLKERKGQKAKEEGKKRNLEDRKGKKRRPYAARCHNRSFCTQKPPMMSILVMMTI